MEEDIIKEEPINTEVPETPEAKVEEKAKKINIKLIIIIAVIIVLGVLAYFGKGLLIAATVDGSPIGRLSVIHRLEKASGKNMLDALITQKLVQNEAKAKNIVISADEVNADLKTIGDQITAQGGTLSEALAQQGMTLDDLKTQIILQKEMEKLLGDKVSVSDEEVAKYIKDNNVPVAKGQEATINAQVKNELTNQKLDSAAQAFIADLKAKAKIMYFVNY